MPYDPDSGLVYTETVVTASGGHCKSYKQHSDRCPGSKPKYEAPSGGVHSLGRIAMRRILCHLDLLEPAALNSVPLHFVERIWEAARRSSLDSVETWQLFAQTPLGTRTFVRSWRISYRGDCHQHQLPHLVKVAALSDCWLTNLTLSNCEIPVQALVSVAELHNLQNIHVHRTQDSVQGTFSDHVVKAWARAAKEDDAFTSLETIFVNGQKGITAGSLYHLSSFPKLDTFCAQSCGMPRKWGEQTKAVPMGWNAQPR